MGCCSSNLEYEEFKMIQQMQKFHAQRQDNVEGRTRLLSNNLDKKQDHLVKENEDEDFIDENRDGYVSVDFRNVDISPGNIRSVQNQGEMTLAYKNCSAVCTSDGHSLTFCVTKAGDLYIFNEEPFEFIGIQFHSPSIHSLKNCIYPLEMHFIHRHRETGELAILAQLFSCGATSLFLSGFIDGRTPPSIDESFRISLIDFNSYDVSANYVCYDTYPTAKETTLWFVNMDVASCNPEQLNWIRSATPYSVMETKGGSDADRDEIARLRISSNHVTNMTQIENPATALAGAKAPASPRNISVLKANSRINVFE